MHRTIFFITVVSLTFYSTLSMAQHEEEAEQAQQVAKEWLPLVDKEQYSESWDVASPLFQQSVTQDQWAQAAKQVRDPLGALQSRDVKKAEYTTSLPKAPEGEYVVVEYASAFSNLEDAAETVVMTKT